MIISRKNRRVCAREGGVLQNYCERPESRATYGCAQSCGCFCSVVVVHCLCVALIQIKKIFMQGMR